MINVCNDYHELISKYWINIQSANYKTIKKYFYTFIHPIIIIIIIYNTNIEDECFIPHEENYNIQILRVASLYIIFEYPLDSQLH